MPREVAAPDSTSLVAAYFRKADILIQTDELATATRVLEEIIAVVPSADARVAALCRLVEIACDRGEIDVAQKYFAESSALARGSAPLSQRGASELAAAEGCLGASLRNAACVDLAARRLEEFSSGYDDDKRLWVLIAKTLSRVGSIRYVDGDFASASDAYARADRALNRAGDYYSNVRAHLLMLRGVVDVHDVDRAHLALGQNVTAYGIAVDGGMTATAGDALFNIVAPSVFCDDDLRSHAQREFVREILHHDAVGAVALKDIVCAAAVADVSGRQTVALDLVERAEAMYRDGPHGFAAAT
ncbi:MAG TPA: hypothetical protein VGF18_10500, partial [Candidatus Tumulicola sp.]